MTTGHVPIAHGALRSGNAGRGAGIAGGGLKRTLAFMAITSPWMPEGIHRNRVHPQSGGTHGPPARIGAGDAGRLEPQVDGGRISPCEVLY